MKSTLNWCPFFVGVVFAALLVGCGSSESPPPASSDKQHDDDHDHKSHEEDGAHAKPESLAEAVVEVEQLCNAIQSAFAEGDLDKADGPVHELGHLLEELPKLAAKESLSEAGQQQVQQAVDSLMDSFGALDERIHHGDGEGKSYDEVASSIDDALAELKSVGMQEKSP